MPNFAPDQVTFGDVPGLGDWDIAHYREHQQFVQVLAEQTPPILLDNYDLMQMLTAGGERSAALESHNVVHTLLRQITGVGGTDYSQFNYDSEDDFYSFLGYHSTEHQQLRQALGIG
jgi:hypothetical protein